MTPPRAHRTAHVPPRPARLAAAVVSLAVLGASWSAGPAAAGDRDGWPPEQAVSDRLAAVAAASGRSVQVRLDHEQGLGWASLTTGEARDEVWLDRSLDGGKTIEDGGLGRTTIAEDESSATTDLFELAWPTPDQQPVLRACVRTGDDEEPVCTDWVGQEDPPAPTTPARDAVDALMELYDPGTGLFLTTGWWNNANALTAVIDYSAATGDARHDWVIAHTYEKNLDAQDGDFTNEYIDDTGWWALAWIRAYDHTGDPRYLETAQVAADYMWSYRDDVCGGGLWWRTDKTYKNAVTNELYIKVGAELHQRLPGDRKYLEQAVSTWDWFAGSGMINSEGLVNDGLDMTTCESNLDTTWSYNQGIVLGGLNALHLATGEERYLDEATRLAEASTTSDALHRRQILAEPCESGDCGADGPTFKGVYVRNLAELTTTTGAPEHLRYLDRQARATRTYDRNPYHQHGLRWAGPFDTMTAATQTSALEALTAPLRVRAG